MNCHATNLARNYNPEKNTFASTWTEMGIGCEACHGAGQAHIDDPEHQKTFTMKKVPARQIFDTCAYCHGNKNNVFFGFRPGDSYEDYALPFLISQPIPDNDPQGEFWPDGRASRFNRPQALTAQRLLPRGTGNLHQLPSNPRQSEQPRAQSRDRRARRRTLAAKRCAVHAMPRGGQVEVRWIGQVGRVGPVGRQWVGRATGKKWIR